MSAHEGDPALVLLSGGLDSTVAGALYRERSGPLAQALWVDYGQRAAEPGGEWHGEAHLRAKEHFLGQDGPQRLLEDVLAGTATVVFFTFLDPLMLFECEGEPPLRP